MNKAVFYADIALSLIGWKVWKVRRSRKVFYTTRSGERFMMRRFAGDSNAIWEEYEDRVYDPFLPPIKKGDWIVDAGGHIGTFAIDMVRRFEGIRVASLEPDEDSRELFNLNIEINSVGKRMKVLPWGIAGRTGRRKFKSDSAMTMGSRLVKRSEEGVFVECVSLAELFQRLEIHRCVLLKMDCEGAEYETLLSCPNAVLKKVDTILVEWHAGGDRESVVAKLKRSGFMVTEHLMVRNPVARMFWRARISVGIRM